MEEMHKKQEYKPRVINTTPTQFTQEKIQLLHTSLKYNLHCQLDGNTRLRSRNCNK
jgi:hypothetical protein